MDAVAEVKAYLPGWTGWLAPAIYLQIGGVFAAFGLVWLYRFTAAPLTRVVELAKSHGYELPWTERARLGYAARYEFTVLAVLFLMGVGAIGLGWNGAFSFFSGAPLGLILALLLAFVALHLSRTRLRPLSGCAPLTFAQQLRGIAIHGWVMNLWGWWILAALLAPRELLSSATVVWLGAMTAFVVGAQFGLPLHVGRVFRLVAKAPPGMAEQLTAFARQRGIPLKRVLRVRSQAPNTDVRPSLGALLITDGLLEEFTEEEVIALAVREMGAMQATRRQWLGSLAFRLVLLPIALGIPVIQLWGMPGGLALVVLLYIALRIYSRVLLKELALGDSFAANHGHGPACARALEKLARVSGIPLVIQSKDPTANVYERMLALGYQPDYPRPELFRVRSGLVLAGMLSVLVVTLVGTILLPRLPSWLLPGLRQRVGWQMSVAPGDGSVDLMFAGRRFYRQNEPERGEMFYRAALELSEEPGFVYAHRAETWADAGRCSDAEVSLDAAFPEAPTDHALLDALDDADEAVSHCWRRLEILDRSFER